MNFRGVSGICKELRASYKDVYPSSRFVSSGTCTNYTWNATACYTSFFRNRHDKTLYPVQDLSTYDGQRRVCEKNSSAPHRKITGYKRRDFPVMAMLRRVPPRSFLAIYDPIRLTGRSLGLIIMRHN